MKSLARQFLKEPEFLSLTEGGVRSPEEIEHYHCIVPANEKDQWLLRILEYEEPDSAIIFCNTREDTALVADFLRKSGMDSYVFLRPQPSELELPGPIFRWRSPDGSEVLAYRIPHEYCSPGADLDGHLLIEPADWRGLGFADGRIVLSPEPGLGVHRVGA